MVSEIIEFMSVNPEGKYADLTFGEGGHTDALLEAGAGFVTGVDRDEETLQRYQAVGKFREDARLSLIHARYSDFADSDYAIGLSGVLMDLGVSTRQLLEPERGFSFVGDAPLDMRMDRTSDDTLSARLKKTTPEELARVLEDRADVPHARRIASELLTRFAKGRLETTQDLAELMPGKNAKGKHNATTLFMALRMWVNDELEEVQLALPRLVDRMAVGGRVIVLTFHSTEDRLVKRTLKSLAGDCICGMPECRCPRVKRVTLVTRKPLLPERGEVRTNPRARSVKLRCVEKTA